MKIRVEGELGDQIARIVKKTNVKIEDVVLDFGNKLAEAALRNTPVKTGFLRASWFVSIGSPQGGVPVSTADARKTTGAFDPATLGTMSLVLSQADVGEDIYFLNGARYARAVEYGGPNRPARRYVRRTVDMADELADELIREYGVR